MPTGHANGRVTQKTIAEQTGVSQALVSMVVSGRASAGVSEQTRARILQVATSLGYAPDRTAQMLRLRRNWTIACAVPDITNPFYPALERGIQEVALSAGYDVLVVNTDGLEERERRLVGWCRQGRVDGLVGAFFSLQPADLEAIERTGTPAVCIGLQDLPPNAVSVDGIFTDNRRAAADATTYLLSRGHRDLVMIAAETGPGPARVAGFRATMHEAGLPVRIAWQDGFTEAAGHEAARHLIANRLPSAVFCANDLIAAGCLLAFRQAGIGVPDRVAVMGFDDIQLAHLLTPALTTVNQFQHEIGRTAAAMLIERLADPQLQGGRLREMPYRLVARQSA